MYYPVSDDLRALLDNAPRQEAFLTVTLADSTILNLTDEDIVSGGLSVDRYSMNGERLELGNVSAHQLSLTLINRDYWEYDFDGAVIDVTIGVGPEYIKMGTYYVTECDIGLSTIKIIALDYLSQLDVRWDFSGVSFPATVPQILAKIESNLGITITLGTGSVNTGYYVNQAPTGNSITYRQVLGWAAAFMGYNQVFVDFLQPTTTLKMARYLATDTRFALTNDHRYNSAVASQDAYVSGVVYNDGGTPLTFGTDEYALDLSGNALIANSSQKNSVLSTLNSSWNGFSYRPYTAATLVYPFLMPVDTVDFTDRKGITHFSIVSHMKYVLNSKQSVKGKGVSPTTAEAVVDPVTTTTKEAADAATEAAVVYVQGTGVRTTGVFIDLDNYIEIKSAIASVKIGKGTIEVKSGGLTILKADAAGLSWLANSSWLFGLDCGATPFTDWLGDKSNLVTLTDLKNLDFVEEWQWNDPTPSDTSTDITLDINFISNNTRYAKFNRHADGHISYTDYDNNSTNVTNTSGAFTNQSYRKIVFVGTTIDPSFEAFLSDNATKL